MGKRKTDKDKRPGNSTPGTTRRQKTAGKTVRSTELPDSRSAESVRSVLTEPTAGRLVVPFAAVDLGLGAHWLCGPRFVHEYRLQEFSEPPCFFVGTIVLPGSGVEHDSEKARFCHVLNCLSMRGAEAAVLSESDVIACRLGQECYSLPNPGEADRAMDALRDAYGELAALDPETDELNAFLLSRVTAAFASRFKLPKTWGETKRELVTAETSFALTWLLGLPSLVDTVRETWLDWWSQRIRSLRLFEKYEHDPDVKAERPNGDFQRAVDVVIQGLALPGGIDLLFEGLTHASLPESDLQRIVRGMQRGLSELTADVRRASKDSGRAKSKSAKEGKNKRAIAFGKRLRTAREKMGWSTRELAEAVGMKQPAIVRYETGRQVPWKDQIERFAGALGVSVHYLAPFLKRKD